MSLGPVFELGRMVTLSPISSQRNLTALPRRQPVSALLAASTVERISSSTVGWSAPRSWSIDPEQLPVRSADSLVASTL